MGGIGADLNYWEVLSHGAEDEKPDEDGDNGELGEQDDDEVGREDEKEDVGEDEVTGAKYKDFASVSAKLLMVDGILINLANRYTTLSTTVSNLITSPEFSQHEI